MRFCTVGMTKSSFCFGPAERSGKLNTGKVELANFVVGREMKQHFRIPSKVGILPLDHSRALGEAPICEMIFGHEVDEKIEAGTITSGDVFELIKYGIFPEYKIKEHDPSYGAVHPLIRSVKKKHNALCQRVMGDHGGKVDIRDGLTDSTITYEVKTIEVGLLTYPRTCREGVLKLSFSSSHFNANSLSRILLWPFSISCGAALNWNSSII